MTYPKQVTEQPLAAARERLRAANINPDGEVYAENMAFMILEGTVQSDGDGWDAAEEAGHHARSDAAVPNCWRSSMTATMTRYGMRSR